MVKATILRSYRPQMVPDDQVELPCDVAMPGPSVPPSYHLPTLPILQFQTPLLDTQLQKPPVHSAMLPPRPLLWAVLRCWPDLGQRAPFESPGSCLYMSSTMLDLARLGMGLRA